MKILVYIYRTIAVIIITSLTISFAKPDRGDGYRNSTGSSWGGNSSGGWGSYSGGGHK